MRVAKLNWCALAIGLGIEVLLVLTGFAAYAARPYAPLWIESLAKGSQEPSLQFFVSLIARFHAVLVGRFACLVALCLVQGVIYSLAIYLALITFRYFSHAPASVQQRELRPKS